MKPVFDPKAQLTALPRLPGVYRFLSERGQVLYVGKAADLRQRVSSYFQKSASLSPRIRLMVGQIAAIETTVVRSASEALVLENNLIKALAPRYNILFRDDKSYPYLLLSGHTFPRLAYYRGAVDKRHQTFGPFPSASSTRESIKLLQKIFRLRTCEDSVYAHRTRPCLLHQIGQCSAPCVGQISKEAYAQDVAAAAHFLQGKTRDVLEQLNEKMEAASERQAYEHAARYRDQIRQLATVQEKQFVSSNRSALDIDVIAAVREHGLLCVNRVMIRGGRHVGDNTFFPEHGEDCDLTSTLLAFLTQHYLERSVPSLIVCPLPEAREQDDADQIDAVSEEAALEEPPPERTGTADAATDEGAQASKTSPGGASEVDTRLAELLAQLSTQAGRAVRLVQKPVGERRVWWQMARANARQMIAQRQSLESSQQNRWRKLCETLALPESARRVECFDISHTQGEATVASCVICVAGEMRPKEYRRYNITGITPGDDYAAMEQVLTRRYGDDVALAVAADEVDPGRPVGAPSQEVSAAGENPTDAPETTAMAMASPAPDLVLIDGGKGQMTVAERVFAQRAAAWQAAGKMPPPVLLVGVAKGEARKPGLETLLIPSRGQVLHLPDNAPALHLIQTIRDEAHRFAITGHRARRGKARVRSSLEDIEGVGTRRRQRLLTRFGGLQGVRAASVDDLCQVEGIHLALAERIYRVLHS